MLSRLLVLASIVLSLSGATAFANEDFDCGMARFRGSVAVPLSVAFGIAEIPLLGLADTIAGIINTRTTFVTPEEAEKYEMYQLSQKNFERFDVEKVYNHETDKYCAADEKDKPVAEASVQSTAQASSSESTDKAASGQ